MDGLMKRILYLVSEDWYFCSHRLPLAIAAQRAGYEVIVVTKVSKCEDVIRKSGFRLIPVDFRRSADHPFKDLFLLLRLIRIYNKEKPDLCHHVALKAVLMGSIAAYITKTPVIINAFTGLGYVFSSNQKKAGYIRKLIEPLLIFFTNRDNFWSIFQNGSDRQYFLERTKAHNRNCVLIKGSGVNYRQFSLPSADRDVPVVVLASRMLKDKGVVEFVETGRLFHKDKIKARFVLVGDVDFENPMSVKQHELKAWQAEGAVEWWGYHDDMAKVFQKADIVCLPSYHEGLPKVLLEAAAAGKPLVATDIPGCREIVKHEVTGLLVPVGDSTALFNTIKRLINDKELRYKLGNAGLELVKREFDINIINSQTIDLYAKALRSLTQEKLMKRR